MQAVAAACTLPRAPRSRRHWLQVTQHGSPLSLALDGSARRHDPKVAARLRATYVWARRGEASCMSTKRLVSMIAWTLLGALAACEDGGPPNPFQSANMRDAPINAADSGIDASELEADDAGS